MSNITGRPTVAALGMYKQATSASTGTGTVAPDFVTYVGQRFDTSDGRELVLVANGAAALVSGTVIQSAAEIAGFQALAMTVPAAYPATAGLFQILVTNGATVLNVNQFAGGYLIVDSGTGLGQTLKISQHQAAANGATFVVTLEDPIQVTLTASSKITLAYNMYYNVITSTGSTATGAPVGVAFYPVAAAVAPTYNATSGALVTVGVQQYALLAAKGPVGILGDSTVPAVGFPVAQGTATAGAMGVASVGKASIGNTLQSGTSAHVTLVHLNL